MRGRWARAVAASAAVAVAAGCGVPADDEPRAIGSGDVPFGLLEAPASSTSSTVAATVETAPAPVFLVGQGRLAPVERQVRAPGSVREVLGALLAGPTDAEARAGLRTAIALDAAVSGITLDAGVARLNLTGSFGDVQASQQILALAQIVFTATAVPGVQAVAFTLAGRPVEVPTGDGTLKREPLRRADFAAVAPTP